jgi:hypothetical protein
MEKYVSKFEEKFHPKDDLLRGITFEDLIMAVQANEPEVNEKSIKKVYKEMLKQVLEDAEYDLKSNMKDLLKQMS